MDSTAQEKEYAAKMKEANRPNKFLVKDWIKRPARIMSIFWGTRLEPIWFKCSRSRALAEHVAFHLFQGQSSSREKKLHPQTIHLQCSSNILSKSNHPIAIDYWVAGWSALNVSNYQSGIRSRTVWVNEAQFVMLKWDTHFFYIKEYSILKIKRILSEVSFKNWP